MTKSSQPVADDHDKLDPQNPDAHNDATATDVLDGDSKKATVSGNPNPVSGHRTESAAGIAAVGSSKLGHGKQQTDPGDGEDEEQDGEDDEEGDEEEEEDDEEPRLKYVRLTQSLNALYRNGDATSAFLVGGDKMIIGTHNGNIHVVQLPSLNPLRVYHAHSASVTSISISPFPPPLSSERLETSERPQSQAQSRAGSRQDGSPARPSSRRLKETVQLPRTPSNDIYIATSSMDGNVCVQSLLDVKDVHLRNFARPVQAVALSPSFKSDRTYLSGGLAGQLVLSSGVGQGRSTSTTTGTAAAAASGWLGNMGLGTNSGKDAVLHSGEGAISSIKWSLSGKYVAWLNEYGIKVMRSKLHLDSADSEGAWQRIGHYDRPQTEEWDTMASVWKGRVEWIDERAVESDESWLSKAGSHESSDPAALSKKSVERLLVGWGGKIWILHIHPEASVSGRRGQGKPYGRAEVAKILRMDCIISGISMYTRSTLLVLAFCPTEDDDGEDDDGGGGGEFNQTATPEKKSTLAPGSGSARSEPLGGIRRRQNNEPPELRLIDLDSEMEVSKDRLSVSRFERLGAADYYLGVLPAQSAASAVASRGALETLAGLGNDMWNVAVNPKSIFSSGASIMSRDSGDDGASESHTGSTAGTLRRGMGKSMAAALIHPSLAKPGMKIFIHSPYDCVLGSKRDLVDHLAWLEEHEQYRQAWELLEENPDIIAAAAAPEKSGMSTSAATMAKRQSASDDFYDGDSAVESVQQLAHSYAETEKRRVGELWIQQLVEDKDWEQAGAVCGKVLAAPDRWEKWVWTFAGAKHLDEITPYIPTQPTHPPISPAIYEVVLGHYITTDKPRFKELLDTWSTDFFDVNTITTTLENQLKFRDVQEDSVEDGEKGRDWSIVLESLARLYEAGGRHRDALKCYIKLHDADSVFRLIRDRHLAEAVADDIPGFISLRVTPSMDLDEMADATSEAITLLVDEAQHGLVRPSVVVEQLRAKDLYLYLYFYLKGLWRGQGIREHLAENLDRLVMESQSLVDDYADLAVHLFAMFDAPLLMTFLKSSTSYTIDKAEQECEAYSYYDELIYLYSKTGKMHRALRLIIDRLKNVQKAIEFAKEQDDPDLWKDLLDYSMDKPSFIRALLEQVGTAINPVTLIRRIPEGLEIQGLREGLTHMMKEHELQHSISAGVAKVLRSELAASQKDLRAGQQRGIKFQVVLPGNEAPLMTSRKGQAGGNGPNNSDEPGHHDGAPQTGCCAGCREAFSEDETETILGFACGHTFHVSHLMELVHRGRKVDVDPESDSGYNGRYSVGLKVMRARLLRDKVGHGCPICK